MDILPDAVLIRVGDPHVPTTQYLAKMSPTIYVNRVDVPLRLREDISQNFVQDLQRLRSLLPEHPVLEVLPTEETELLETGSAFLTPEQDIRAQALHAAVRLPMFGGPEIDYLGTVVGRANRLVRYITDGPDDHIPAGVPE